MSRPWLPWLLLLLVALGIPVIANTAPWLLRWPDAWVLPLAEGINQMMESLAAALKPFTRAFSAMLEWPMLMLQTVLQWLPWPVIVAAVALLGLQLSGWRLALLATLALLYIVATGYWEAAMNTMALVGIAVPLSLLLGLLFGIAADRTRWGERLIPPVLDVMQTMPTFAYLIPLLVFFGFGPVVGLIASAIYACPPMVRNVHLGLQRIAPEILEASAVAGSSWWQKLFWVELPVAMAQIRIGINQCIMAALSMVIIASVIGGFDDIGWAVLNTMRKARFGESLMAGIVIVLLAVVIDRLSSAYARVSETTTRPGLSRRGLLVALLLLLLATVLIKLVPIQVDVDSPQWARSFARWLDNSLDNVVAGYGDLLTTIKNFSFYYYLLPMRIGFTQTIQPFTWGIEFTEGLRWGYALAAGVIAVMLTLTQRWRLGAAVLMFAYWLYFGTTNTAWLVFMLAITLLAWQMAGVRTALFAAIALAFILLTGMWDKAMLSVYLCGAAALASFVIGGSIGVWAAHSERVSSVVRPIADTFQTIPAFVFLIPVLMFFQIGEFTALLAIIAYAFVPAIRYTENGLRQVPEEYLEVARQQGCSRWQTFWQVKLPLALPTILVGLNQTIMFAFAMLVIAALVGTTGLGQQIYLSLSSADTGNGLIAGLSMALLAMVTDRILQGYAARKFAGY